LNTSIDTVITAETPEGIAIAIRPAGFAVRCTAFLIDAVIRFALFLGLVTALGLGRRFGIGPIFIVAFGLNWLYPVIFELMPAAATPGKRVMGLQVMMANGLPITPAGCLIRNLMRVVDLLPLLYAFAIVLMLLRRDARRLGDLAGGTLVAYRNEAAVVGAIGAGDPIPPPVALSARQQAAIAAFAWRVSRLTPERAEEIAMLAANISPSPDGSATVSSSVPMTARLIGIARWLHGQRRTLRSEARAPV
jgi:uncharacterized RDD family membrane protein YckC